MSFFLQCNPSNLQLPFLAKSLLLGVFGGGILLFSNCSPKTVESPLTFTIPDTFSTSGQATMSDQWWEEFKDPFLNELIGNALDSNYNLLTAWERLQSAEAIVERESSGFYPNLESSVQSAVSRPEPDFVGGENIQFGLRATYEIDLWGRLRSAVDAEKFRAQASLFDYRATAITLSADIATTWFQLRATQRQLLEVQSQVQTNEKTLQLIKNRFGIGQVRSADIWRQEQLLEATRQQAYQLEADLRVLRNQLATLTGKPPGAIPTPKVDSLPQLPSLPQAGVPGELINRRPDVKAAYHRLNAADREVASAISSTYPRLTLSSNASVRANDFESLVNGWAYSIAGNLVAPIFYGGRLKAEVRRTEAVKSQRLHEYSQTVLLALGEVEDALILENRQKDVVSSLKQQLEHANQSYEQLRNQYFNGTSDYLAVLTAQTELQSLERDLIFAQQLLIEYRISLYRALAGGTSTPSPDENPE